MISVHNRRSPTRSAGPGKNRRTISELMNAKVRPSQENVMRILEILGVEGDEWTKIMKIAEDAAARGWWESSARRMGPRQARTADLEAGAATIQEYAATYPPGLLQTPAGFSFPCQCGEHTNQKTQIKAMNGSSPRARGAPGGASTRHAARRVIPACAGSAL